MAEAEINVKIPHILSARADYRWHETDDTYGWYVVISFGKVEVTEIYTGSGVTNEPSAKEIDEVVAAKLKGLFA